MINSASSYNTTQCIHAGVRGNPYEDALLTELFDTRAYNRLSRPVFNLSESIQVQLGLVLSKVVQVVGKSYSYTCNVSTTRCAAISRAL